jgi:hypothetical protein
MTVKTKDETPRVKAKVETATFKNLGQAGASLRLVARRSIRRRKSPSAEGQPPHTRAGQLRRAILYAIEPREQTVVIGPDVEVVGTSGGAHERGGRYRREKYPRRPFMGPALEKIKDRLPPLWAGSVQ